MRIEIYKNTNFGSRDNVVNVPVPDYDYGQHEHQTFNNVAVRFPLLMGDISLQGEYNFNTAFYDYMICIDGTRRTFYFINTITAGRNLLFFDITLDVITTHNLLSNPVSGTIIRQHNLDENEEHIGNPFTNSNENHFERHVRSFVGFTGDGIRFIESAVNLSRLAPAVTINNSAGNDSITVPQLAKPDHNTEYRIHLGTANFISDNSRAFVLYLGDNIDNNILNTIRGLTGDGGISDSYIIPNDAIFTPQSTGANVTQLTSVHKRISTGIDIYADMNMAQPSKFRPETKKYEPKNPAVLGMFSIEIMSTQEKTRIRVPSWELAFHFNYAETSAEIDDILRVDLWCDPKPSGSPFCSFIDLFSDDSRANFNNPSGRLSNLENRGVRGGQWLRAPLIFTMGRGEIFSTQESRLQRERSEFELAVNLRQLELKKDERNIRLLMHDLQFGTDQAKRMEALVSGITTLNMGKVVAGVGGLIAGNINNELIQEIQNLKGRGLEDDAFLIEMANKNNLRNIELQEVIRRTTTKEIVFEPSESLGSYDNYNGFIVTKIQPNIDFLIKKDLEFCLYGYPCFNTVEDYIMLDNLRVNHTVYQFQNPIIELGGKIGDFARIVLQGGIRILSNKYSSTNLIDNPKREKNVEEI